MNIAVPAFRLSVALLFSALATLSQTQQGLRYKFDYKCNGETVVVAYCRRDSDRPGERTPDAANYCSVHYPGQKTSSGWPLEKTELRSDVEAKLRSCGAFATPTRTAASNAGTSGAPDAPSLGDPAYTRARKLIEAKDYSGAMVELKEALRLDPRHARSFYYVGIAQYYLKEYVVASAAFERALQLNVSIRPHNVYQWIGECQKALGDYDRAFSAYREAIRIKPDFAEGYNLIGLVYYLKKDFPNAALFFEQAYRLDSTVSLYRKNLGMAHIGAGKKDEAMKVYNSLLSVDAKMASELLDEITKPATAAAKPRTPAEARLDEANKFYDVKDYVKALAAYQDALRLDPANGTASHYVGMCRYQLKQYPEAISAFENAIKLKYADPQFSNEWIGDAYYELKQYDKALISYAEAIRRKPDYAQALQKHGNSYYSLKRYPEALADYLAAIKLKPDNSTYHTSAGDAYSQLAQHDKAVASFTEATRLDPKNDWALNMLAVSYFRLKQYAGALKSAEQAVKLKPENALYLTNLGDTYFQLGRKADALAVHKKLLALDKKKADELFARINPSLAETALRKGNELLKDEKFVEAIVEYERAVAAKPSNSDLAIAHAAIGYIYIRLRDYDKAATNLLASTRLDPAYAGAFEDLGEVYERTLQFPKAVAAYREAIRLMSDDPGVSGLRYRLGLIYALMGQRANAMEIYTGLQKSDPENARTLLASLQNIDKDGAASLIVKWGIVHETRGETDEALEHFRNAVKLQPANIPALFAAGQGMANLERYDEAMAVYRHVLTLKPSVAAEASAHYFMGQTYNDQKLYAKAIQELRTAQKLQVDYYQSLELGRAYRGLKQFAEALLSFQEAAKLKPDDYEAKVGVARTYIDLGQGDKAIGYLTEATRDPAKTAPILFEELGKLYFSVKRYSEAVTVYKQLIASDPSNRSAKYALGVVYVAMGQKQDAMVVYRVLRPLDNQLAQKLLAEINKP